MKAQETLFTWLKAERKHGYSDIKYNREDNVAGVHSGGMFDSQHFWGRNLRMYADRSRQAYDVNKNKPSPFSMQQLAKHSATVSFLLLDLRFASGETLKNHEELKRLRINIAKGIGLAQREVPTVDYDVLQAHNDVLLGEGDEGSVFKESFDLADQETWTPYLMNLGITAVLLSQEMERGGRLPAGGVPSGYGLDVLMA